MISSPALCKRPTAETVWAEESREPLTLEGSEVAGCRMRTSTSLFSLNVFGRDHEKCPPPKSCPLARWFLQTLAHRFASRSSSWPRTLAFHAGDRGSDPLRDATFHLSEPKLAFLSS